MAEQWEYKSVQIKYDVQYNVRLSGQKMDEAEQYLMRGLNEFGTEGWEVMEIKYVGVTYSDTTPTTSQYNWQVRFKRRKP